jgi:hypothetical protein
MKKLVGLVVVIMMISNTSNSQGKPTQQQRKENDFTTDQKATLQSKKLTLELDLNAKQQNEVYNLLKQNLEEKQKNKVELKKQDGTELSGQQRFEIQNNYLDMQIEHKAAMKSILSEEQYEKWEKLSKGHNKRNKQGEKVSPKNRSSKK